MAETNDEKDPGEQLMELFVYAPVGLALEAVDNLPRLIERGKSQVTLGRFVAKTVTKKGSSTIESFGERLANEAGQIIVDLFGIDLSADPPPPTAASNEVVDDAVSPDGDLAIAEYDSQAAAQIVKLLVQLTPEEREAIGEYEASGRKRVTILRKIEQLRES